MIKEPIITFILIAWKEIHDIHVSLGSLLCQKNPQWCCKIYHDGPNEVMRKQVEYFNDSRITFIEAEKDETNSWGIYNRIRAIEETQTDYILQATVQEYFTPNLVDEIERNKRNDFIYWACVHHSFNYEILDTAPVKGKIDWSNFAIKTSIAKRVGVNYPTAYMADGVFVEDCFKSGLIRKPIKIHKILNIKN